MFRRTFDVLQPAIPKRRSGTLFIGYAEGGLGLGQAFRNDLSAAAQAELPFGIYPFRVGVEDRLTGPFMAERYDETHCYPVNVIEVYIDQVPAVFGSINPRLYGDSYNVLRTYWELPNAPLAWSPMLAGIDEIWAPNSFVRDALKQIFPGPITVIPSAVEVGNGPYLDRQAFGLAPDRFYFLVTFDYFSFPQRKNPLGALVAFQRAFPTGDEKVGLIIKSTGQSYDHPDVQEAIRAAVATDNRITAIEYSIPRNDILSLLRIADAYVSLHRSEGFGLGMAEAMSFGRPVIGTNYSGNTDFLNETTGFPVPYKLRPLAPAEYVDVEGQVWAEPDIDAAARIMRHVYESPANAAERAAWGKRYIRQHHSAGAVGQRIKQRLSEIEAALGLAHRNGDLQVVGAPACSSTESQANNHHKREAIPPVSAVYMTIDTGETGVQGWYRAKVISPEERLRKFSIEVIDRNGLSIGAFASSSPSRQFGAYVFIDRAVTSIRLRLDMAGGRDAGLSATLRQISVIEFIWHSLRNGFLRRPLSFLNYFYRPRDAFILVMKFPRPPRFAQDPYQWWIANSERAATMEWRSPATISITERPSICILMTVCDPQPINLRRAIESVLGQTSPKWQLCIADDASVRPEVRQILSSAASADERIKLALREQRGGMSAAANTAHTQSSTPFVLSLDHDDRLAPSAIETVGTQLARNPNARLVYSDEDKIDQNDRRYMPYFKPDFSPELLYSCNYFNHLTVYHSATLHEIGGWRGEFDGAHDYDVNLRMIEATEADQIVHVPAVLYHLRSISGSAARDPAYNRYALEAGRRALEQHFAKRAVPARAEIVAGAMYRVRYGLPNPQPPVSIIIPFRDRPDLLRPCVSSIVQKTTYRRYEIVLVDNGSIEASTEDLLKCYAGSDRIRVLRHPGPFNYAALINRAAEQASADYLCLLNNDTLVIAPDWLEDMVGYASQPGVGCVGAKLYYPNGTVQHAGVVLGIGGSAAHAFVNHARHDSGYFGRLLVASNYSAVTAACLMVNRSIFDEAGGMDENALPIAFNDIDLCINVSRLGYRNVFTPFAELYHFESASRGREDTPEKERHFQREAETFKQRHSALLQRDPFYSPHLTLTKADFSIRVD